MTSKLLLLLISSFLLTFIGKSISSEECFSSKTNLNLCHCEKSMALNKDYYPASEAKLICIGNGAINEAKQLSMQPAENILFIELNIKSSSQAHLTYDLLKGFPHLKKLILADNEFNLVEEDSFRDSSLLEDLHLSHNGFLIINNDTFAHLINLKFLSLAYNKIESIGIEAFHPMLNLISLDLTGNKLYEIESKWFSSSKKLEDLAIADNDLVSLKLNSFHLLQSLETLDMSENEISELPDLVFYQLKNLRKINLAKNNLKKMNKNLFKGNKLLEKVNLTGNLWTCDKLMVPWLDWLRIHEFDRAYCYEPEEFVNLTLQVGLNLLYLEVKLEENNMCSTSRCNCTVNKNKQIVTLDCVARGFTKLPENLPYMTRVMDLRDNQITSLAIDHINATQWSGVTFLHLNNNLIDSLRGLEGTSLVRHLVALHLTNNRLNDIPIHILEQFRGGLLDELYLSGNPWNCDCNTVRFQTWLQDNYKTIKDFDEIRCSKDSGVYSNQPIGHLLKSQLCPQQDQFINYLDVLNGLMAVVIVLIIVKLSVDFWVQKRTGKLPQFFSLNL